MKLQAANMQRLLTLTVHRFYGRDMLHPSELAVDYIWSKLLTARFAPAVRSVAAAVAAVAAAAAHRPFNPASAAHQTFLKKQLLSAAALEAAQPGLDLSAERAVFESGLLPAATEV
jgi:hypothetical protein